MEMKIVKLETFCNRFVGFLVVTDEAGNQGWGQFSTYNSARLRRMLWGRIPIAWNSF